MNNCFLDLDGLLVDFYGHLQQLYNITGYNSEYDIFADIPISREEFLKSTTTQFWEDLPLTQDAVDIITTVRKYFTPNNIVILSCPTPINTASCIAGKLNWLNRHFPEIKRTVFTSEKQLCASYKNILIDDYHKNVVQFRQAGGYALLFPRRWNEAKADADNAISILDRFLNEHVGAKKLRCICRD